MKHLNLFENEALYEAFKSGSDFILPNVSFVEDVRKLYYNPYIMSDMRDSYLTIEALEDGLTASLTYNSCEYCVDGDGNWKNLAADAETESINSGQTLSFRGNLKPVNMEEGYDYNGIGTFTISKKCNLKGNCMSMLFGDNAADNYSLEGKAYAFVNLFYNCSNIINVSSNFLPATTLANSCYNYMFWGCTSLTTTPKLPATNLTGAYLCYNNMFRGCTSLTAAPELPATTLESTCYEYMFEGYTKLNHIKMLATDISARSCLEKWVSGVATTGTFVKNPTMINIPTGNNGIPEGWTVIDAA